MFSTTRYRSVSVRSRTPRFVSLHVAASENDANLKISYSDLIGQIKDNEIVHAEFQLNDPHVHVLRENGQHEEVVVPSSVIPQTMTQLIEYGANVRILESELGVHDVSTILLWMIQFVVFIAIGRMVLTNAVGGNNSINSFLKFGNADGEDDSKKDTGVRFDDIAGADAAKMDLQEVVDFLKNPEVYTRVGAKIPKGLLLYGPSGVGKTQISKAVAGEAGVPFFACSGSQFIEMFVGVGSSRLRSLFDKAKKAAPSIIFIDEIDAIGKKRSGGEGMDGGGGSSEHDQTINQLLTCMDGFIENTGVIVIGATNRIDVLDEALLRPGRFDRRVYVELPDRVGRRGILGIHTRGKPLSKEVDLESLSKRTVGFSGADLESLCNEAAIYAARAKRDIIIQKDFDMAMDKLTIGEERKTTYVSDEKKRILAIHESGHALMGMILDFPDKVHKVTIVPRGHTGGATYFEPNEDSDLGLQSREYLEHHIMVTLGGRAAEELTFGKQYVTTGASGDLEEIYNMASRMIINYGFSEELGQVSWSQSEGFSAEIEMEIKTLVDRLYSTTSDLLFQHRSHLEELSNLLYENETLDVTFLEEFAKVVHADVIESRFDFESDSDTE